MQEPANDLFPPLDWALVGPDAEPDKLSLDQSMPLPADLAASDWSDASPSLGDSLFSLDFDASDTSPLEQSEHATPQEPPLKRTCMPSDFTLFPDVPPTVCGEHYDAHASVYALLQDLEAREPVPPSMSPDQLTSAPPPAPQPAQAVKLEQLEQPSLPTLPTLPPQPQQGGRRRRRDAAELLPLDAPVQPRNYLTESATSRRDEPMDSSTEKTDARTQKRMSNTIAARRSRHRKAEELKQLYETIESLRSQVALWRGRYEELSGKVHP